MKKILTLALAFSCGAVFAQKADNVGIGTSKPDPSAILDLSSNTKGLLLPRMSEAQRNAIKNPAAGLIIFQTDQVIGTYTFDGTAWQPSNARTSATNVAGAWDKQGNAIDGTDFLGTTSANDLRFKVANIDAGRIRTNGAVAFGQYAGNASLGANNVAIGNATMFGSTSGTANVALGFQAMRNNSGSDNVGIGTFALIDNTGTNNVAIGPYASYKNTGGSYNFAFGSGALLENLTGSNNVAIGPDALRFITGSRNTGIGRWAGRNATGSDNVFIGNAAGANETGSNMFYVSNTDAVNPLMKGNFSSNWLKINSKTAGYLAVGDFDAGTPMPTPAGYRLIVQDGILTEKLKVALRSDNANWADYVFEPNYKLMPLEEVEKYTKDNKHLPNVPSADEITKEGIDVAKVSKMFMEKIEELTLHVIELNKRIKELEAKK